MTAIIAYSWRSTSFELVSGGSSSSTGFGVLLPFSPPGPDKAWWAHSVLRMKAAVALSERKSDVDLVGSMFGEPVNVEAGREISLGFARPESDAGESFASLGWSRDGSSGCVGFEGSWFMAGELALYEGRPSHSCSSNQSFFINFLLCAGMEGRVKWWLIHSSLRPSYPSPSRASSLITPPTIIEYIIQSQPWPKQGETPF